MACRDMVKMQYQVFRYTKYYHKMQAQELLLDLLNDENAQKALQASAQEVDQCNSTQFAVPAPCAYDSTRPAMSETGSDCRALHALQVLLKSGEWLPVNEPITKVDVELIPCTLTRSAHATQFRVKSFRYQLAV